MATGIEWYGTTGDDTKVGGAGDDTLYGGAARGRLRETAFRGGDADPQMGRP